MKNYILFTILITLGLNSFGQNDLKKIVYLQGKIVSELDNKSVAFAHVINISSRMVTVSDTSGEFSMTILKGDTLRISSIGFEPYYMSLIDSTVSGDDKQVTIVMKNRNYNLSEIDVYRLRWAEFEFEFLNTEVEKNETGDKLKKLVFTDILEQDLKHTKLAQSAGVLLAFDMPSWKSRSRKKVQKMEKKDELQALVEQKFNEEVVGQISGLKGNELKQFIDYCQLDPIYIINVSDYELLTRIKFLLKQYKNRQFK